MSSRTKYRDAFKRHYGVNRSGPSSWSMTQIWLEREAEQADKNDASFYAIVTRLKFFPEKKCVTGYFIRPRLPARIFERNA